MARNEATSKRIAAKAEKLLKDPKAPKSVKSLAASALTQARDRKIVRKKLKV
jgi:hypothetical protein